MISPPWRIRRLDNTASTNDDVRRAAEAGEGEGLVIVAAEQSAGRGRQGRVWESPAGNLYCSVLLCPTNMQQQAPLYSFVASLAVYDTVVAFLPRAAVTLKWPNDILVSGKKISGILLEVTGDVVIIGVGLNIAHYPADALYPATSLKTEGAGQVEPAAALEGLLERLRLWHDLMQTKGFAPVREKWLERAQRGKLTVRLPQETLQGDFAGLDEQGRLRLLLERGAERAISAGDVLGIQDLAFGIQGK
jgi:BirA family transcriptional regulator, biotin operon repressor / biotin---[acetyl-CoA-carboxylase] ligase